MIDYKKTTAPKTTITRDMNELTEKVGNVYETVAILGKRSNQISTTMKKELDAKLLTAVLLRWLSLLQCAWVLKVSKFKFLAV